VSEVSSFRDAVLIYQVYGAWIAGQFLATHRPWENWPVGQNTDIGLFAMAILVGMIIRTARFIRRLTSR